MQRFKICCLGDERWKARSGDTLEIKAIVTELLGHLIRTRLFSYDPMDIYESSWGRLTKRIWKRNRLFGAALALPLELLDILYPSVRNRLSGKRIHPICCAQLGLGIIKLIQINLRADNSDFSNLADQYVERLMALATRTDHGLGWGINVRWETKGGMLSPLTPCHTQTGYAFRFLDEFNVLKGDGRIASILRDVAEHTARDFAEFKDEQTGAVVTGYSIADKRLVVNAISYRMFTMFRAFELFGEPLYFEKATESLRYVLDSQNRNGSWYYGPSEPFIDNYHSCFVLKNLFDSLQIIKRLSPNKFDSDLLLRGQQAFNSGASYFRDYLLDADGMPRPFAVSKKPVLYRYDIYDIAESIGLMIRVGDIDAAMRIFRLATQKMRIPGGGYRSRYYPLISGISGQISYHRYANTALFLSFTSLVQLLELHYE